ncbi:MAG: right-handed parallel beta-helix repeat-containing protein [Candidatus Hodarchaeales archaeon]
MIKHTEQRLNRKTIYIILILIFIWNCYHIQENGLVDHLLSNRDGDLPVPHLEVEREHSQKSTLSRRNTLDPPQKSPLHNTNKILERKSLINNEKHDPIMIDGNIDFVAQVRNEDWPGDGSEFSPYVISGFDIFNSEFSAIQISNTNAFFQISNCRLINDRTGISLDNVKNGHIFNNTIYNAIGGQNISNERSGISISRSKNNLIEKNTISKTEWALQLGASASYNIISSNTIFDNINGIMVTETSNNNKVINNHAYRNGLGIQVSSSLENEISYNRVFNNSWIGIYGEQIWDSLFYRNRIHDCVSEGIWIKNGINISITANFVYRNGGDGGIKLLNSLNSLISNNTLSDNFFYGIHLEGTTDSIISSNTIIDSSWYGIYLNNDSNGSIRNRIEWNNFFGNAFGSIVQARNEGSTNTFARNFWDDQSGSDVDEDGFIDIAYEIEGIGQDPFPLVSSHFFVTKPIISPPKGGEILNATITIEWNAVTDSYGHTITYSIYYSREGGLIWNIVASDLTETSYEWDTNSTVGSTFSGAIKIVATCSEGFMGEEISENVFTIDNIPPPLNYLLFISLVALFGIFCAIPVGYYVVKKKLRTPSFTEFFQSDQTEFLKPLYHKVVIGLENIKTSMISEFVNAPLLEPLEKIEPLDSVETTSLNTYFPSDIQETLKSIKGRTALVLIEMAYQDLLETNPTKLSQSLNIPPSSISDEIKKLIGLDFIVSDVKLSLIQDTRYKYYNITSKGFQFLSSLKGALELSINRLRSKEA